MSAIMCDMCTRRLSAVELIKICDWGQPTAGEDKYRVGQFDNRKVSQIAHVDAMADDAGKGDEEREAIDNGQQDLNDNYAVYNAGEDLSSKDGVLLDRFREIVESTCYRTRISTGAA